MPVFTTRAVTVTGTLVDLNGDPLDGTLQVTCNSQFTDFDGKVHVYPSVAETYTVTTGTVNFQLEGSDYTVPTDISWTVKFVKSGSSTIITLFTLPVNYDDGATRDIKDLIQIAAITGNITASQVTDILNSIGNIKLTTYDAVVSNSTELRTALDAGKKKIFLRAGPTYLVSGSYYPAYSGMELVGEKWPSDLTNSLEDGVLITGDNNTDPVFDKSPTWDSTNFINANASTKIGDAITLTTPQTWSKGTIFQFFRVITDPDLANGPYFLSRTANAGTASTDFKLDTYVYQNSSTGANLGLYVDTSSVVQDLTFKNMFITCLNLSTVSNITMENVRFTGPTNCYLGDNFNTRLINTYHANGTYAITLDYSGYVYVDGQNSTTQISSSARFGLANLNNATFKNMPRFYPNSAPNGSVAVTYENIGFLGNLSDYEGYGNRLIDCYDATPTGTVSFDCSYGFYYYIKNLKAKYIDLSASIGNVLDGMTYTSLEATTVPMPAYNTNAVGGYSRSVQGLPPVVSNVSWANRHILTPVTSSIILYFSAAFLTLPVDTTGGVVTITLDNRCTFRGNRITIKDVGGNAATNNITVNTGGDYQIEGGASYIINTNNDVAVFEFVHVGPTEGDWQWRRVS